MRLAHGPRRSRASASLVALAVAAAALPACRVGSVGTCNATSDCTAGSACDKTQDPPVCVSAQGTCFPACASGTVCQGGQCGPPACNPPCDAAHVCDTGTLTCTPLTAPTVAVTSPAAAAFAGATLQATADARAPGGVTSVAFEVRRAGALLLRKDAVLAATASDPANWAVTLALAGLADGAAQLTAVATWSGGTATSAAVALTVDLTPPALAAVTDGRLVYYGTGATASFVATVHDSGAGVAPGSVLLTLTGTDVAPIAATLSGSTATFSIPITDAVVASGGAQSIPLRLDARDAAGNAASLSGAPGLVLLADRAAPTGGQDAPFGAWVSGSDTVAITGTIADARGSIGSLDGGAASVTLLQGAKGLATAALSAQGRSGTWSAQLDLSKQALAAAEGPWPFTVRLTDSAGNVTTVDGGLLVDNVGPNIRGIAVLTPPEAFAADGRPLYRGAGPDLTVAASIDDASGVDAATVCLRAGYEDGGCHPGAPDGGSWTFALPRPGSAPEGGTAPSSFTVAAADLLAGRGGAAGAAHHTSTSAPQPVSFDNQPPSISVVFDNAHYRRTAPDGGSNVIAVQALLDDPASVFSGPGTPALTAAGSSSAYVARDGGLYTFALDPRLAPAGAEGPLGFTISAQDGLGNAVVYDGGARFVDDAPPALTVSVYRDPPASAPPAGVTYPAPAANTGLLGSNFLYGDTVHVAGTLSDPSGIAAGAALRVDGVEGIASNLPVAVTRGTTLHPLGCTPGATSCRFDVTVAFDESGAGAFHTTGQSLATPYTNNGANGAAAAYPQGPMQLTVIAADGAQVGAQVLGNSAETPTQATVSRVAWVLTLPSLSQVNGLVVHPDGELIVTGTPAGNGDPVVSVRGPAAAGGAGSIAWSFGGGLLGTVSSPAAVGAGDASAALIYVASQGRFLYALAPDGGVAWHTGSVSPFYAAPLVLETTAAGQAVEEVVAASRDTANGATSVLVGAWADGGTVSTTQVALDNTDRYSSPIALDGGIYFGTGTSLTAVAASDGGFGAPAHTLIGNGPFWSPVTDGAAIYAAQREQSGGTRLYRVDPALNSTAAFPLTLANPASSDFVLDTRGEVLLPGQGAGNQGPTYALTSIASDGSFALLASPSGTPRTPLLGAAGDLFLPRATGYLNVFLGAAPAWEFDPPNTVANAAALDCQGVLYFASGNVIYALFTEDRGLADGPWPAYRRDARNTGNAAAPRYGVRSGGACTQ